MNKLSIKMKVTLWYTLIMVIMSIVSIIASSFMLTESQNIIIEECTDKLLKQVVNLVPTISSPYVGVDYFPTIQFYEDDVHMAVYDEDGVYIHGMIPFEFIDKSQFVNEVVQEEVIDGKTYLIYDREVKKIEKEVEVVYWLRGVVLIEDQTALFKSVTKTNMIIIFILVVSAILGGYWIINQSLKPVKKITDTAKRISESRDLSQRIDLGKGEDEIHVLANTFDEMFDKIEKTFQNEKQFISDASHELRTPVAVISSECEYALECTNTFDEIKESISSIKKQNSKMSKLISELLMLSRMDRNAMALNLENLDISELLNFVCDEQEEIHKETIKLKRNIAPNIFGLIDSILMARLFINLISNAYNYGKEDGTIKVTLYEDKNEIVMMVSDDGIGISEENLPKIWERFYQVDSVRMNENGSMGLGLSMVKIIAEKHGGTVSVRSKLGEGTTFTFMMPKTKIE